jgi:hypothetical protein
MTIYISGQISGLPEAEALNNFAKAIDYLEAKYPDAEVVSPMHDITHFHDKSWESYMKEDIHVLLRCDTIALLPNWRNSKGAKLEYLIARSLNFKIIRL